jgi:hypothetical protein
MKRRTEQLVDAITTSLDENSPHRVTTEILSVEGYSGAKYKRFANRLLSKDIVKNYLEIGVWKGSTAISALYGNHQRLKYTLVDNFSSLGGPREEFNGNWNRFIDGSSNLIDEDCFSFNPKDRDIKDIDVYFYDGEHQEIDHHKALQHYYDAMAESFIFMVDDWSWKQVQDGTLRAINDLGLKIAEKRQFFSADDHSSWWNGCGIFVLEK